MAEYTKEMFVLDKFDGHITNEWDIVASASIFKKELKDNEAEKEVILGYANALNCIANSLLKQNHDPTVIMTFRQDSLSIPFVFLARHTVELSLKYLCKLLNIEFQPRHRLMTLWENIMAHFNKFNLIQDNELEDIKVFIEALEELDCDGSHARYSKDIRGKLYNDKPKFINVRNLNNFIQNLFIKLISSFKIV